MRKIGILHPGEMGSFVAASAINSGHEVYWVATGRIEQTHARAKKSNLFAVQALSELCQTCDVIVSVCPPHAAEEVAKQVIAEAYYGYFLDANAISPQRAIRMGQMMEKAHINFIDGSIIGGPAWKPGETWLYLSGEKAEVITGCFKNGPLGTKVIGAEAGKASALKMCYAAYSKGTTALLVSILAAAESLSVREVLYQQWDLDDPAFSEHVNRRAVRAIAKAWRFEGEMKEIASTYQEAGLPNGFHEAAAEIYRRMANSVNMEGVILEEILKKVTSK